MPWLLQLRMLDPFNGAEYEADAGIMKDKGEISLDMTAGQVLNIKLKVE